MMETSLTPSPDPVPVPAPISVPVSAEGDETRPPVPLRELPHAPLLHKGFQNLFRLSIANTVISLLNNTLKLGEKVPPLGILLSIASLATSVLTLITLWKLSAAVPRFRKAMYCNLLPLIVFPFALAGLSAVQEPISESSAVGLLVFGIILLALILLFATLAAYHQLTACAEAFDGVDDTMAQKWRRLCTWQVVLIGIFSAFVVLALLLGLSSASFFYFYNGGMLVLLLFLFAAAIGLTVTEIVELVYLSRSAKLYE